MAGGLGGFSGLRRPGEPPKTRKEAYQEAYQRAKERGEPFYPYTVAKDAVVAFLVFLIVLALAIFVGAETEGIADPTDTSYNPRPEWYFLFLFQFLKYFPGYLEPVAVAVIPALGVLILLLLPFLDRNPFRYPSRRLYPIAAGVLFLGMVGFLTYEGATSIPVAPTTEESRAVAEGRRLYQNLNCTYCHSLRGAGGVTGPDLGVIAAKRDPDWLKAYLQDPHAMVPKTLKPQILMADKDLESLVAYLGTLGARVEYSEEAPRLFEKECSVCHRIAGKGGTVGPDLSRVGSYRDLDWLRLYTENPRGLLPSTKMPAFKDKLNPAQIKDLAAYLYSLKGEEAAPSPTPALPPTASAEVSFSATVRPIFERSCNSCHGAAALGGLDLTRYDKLLTTGAHRPQVVPGNAAASLLYKRLIGRDGGAPMPPDKPLPLPEIEAIARWIDQGALNN